MLWQKVGLDIVYILPYESYQLLIIAHCNLSGWVKAKPLQILFSEIVADFLEKMLFIITVISKS